MSQQVKRLSLQELETWKAKARALDEAVEWLQGRIDSENLMAVDRILRNWDDDRNRKNR